jgi:hypothetical protein
LDGVEVEDIQTRDASKYFLDWIQSAVDLNSVLANRSKGARIDRREDIAVVNYQGPPADGDIDAFGWVHFG